MSRKPSVMSSAVFAPVRSRIVLMAMVEPCRNRPASAKLVPAFATPVSMPSTRASGVDSALPSSKRPLASSKAAMSVKVPPISAASLKVSGFVTDAWPRSSIGAGFFRLPRQLHHVGGRCVDLLDEPLDVRAGNGPNFQVEPLRLGEELRVLHRGIEGRSQCLNPLGRKAGRRRKGPCDAL